MESLPSYHPVRIGSVEWEQTQCFFWPFSSFVGVSTFCSLRCSLADVPGQTVVNRVSFYLIIYLLLCIVSDWKLAETTVEWTTATSRTLIVQLFFMILKFARFLSSCETHTKLEFGYAFIKKSQSTRNVKKNFTHIELFLMDFAICDIYIPSRRTRIYKKSAHNILFFCRAKCRDRARVQEKRRKKASTSLKFEINIFLWKMCHSKLFHIFHV